MESNVSIGKDENLSLNTGKKWGLSTSTYVMAVSLLVLVIVYAIRQIYSPDIGFHLRTGHWILEHFNFPAKDQFTYTSGKNDYVDLYWLYQVFIAIINKISGEFGLVLINAILITISFLLALIRTQRKCVLEFQPHWSAVFFLSIWAASLIFEPMPHVFSWLYLNLLFIILDDYYERGKGKLLYVPMIMLLWTNTNTLFLLGWLVIAAYVVSVALRDRKLWSSLIPYAILSIVASLVNPYFLRGVGMPFYQFKFLQYESVFKDVILEYASPFTLESYTVNGHFVLFQPLFAVHLFFILALVAFIRRLKHVGLHDVILFGIFAYIATTGQKNIGYFIFTALPMTVFGLGSERGAEQSLQSQNVEPKKTRNISTAFDSSMGRNMIAVAIVLASCIFILLITTNAYYIGFRSNYRFGCSYSPYYLPEKAANFLRENKLEGKILNHLNFGGFLIHALPQKVYIDGRNEVMGEDLIGEYYTHWALIDKKDLLEKYNPEIVIFPYQNDFLWVRYFHNDSTWRLAYVDELSAVYLKRGYADQVSRFEPRNFSKEFSPILGAQVDSVLHQEDVHASLSSFCAQQYFPQREIGISTFYYYNDDFDAAVQIGLNGLARSTVPCPEMYYNMGNYFWEKKDFERSAYCYARMLRTNNDGLASARLAQIHAGTAQRPTMK